MEIQTKPQIQVQTQITSWGDILRFTEIDTAYGFLKLMNIERSPLIVGDLSGRPVSNLVNVRKRLPKEVIAIMDEFADAIHVPREIECIRGSTWFSDGVATTYIEYSDAYTKYPWRIICCGSDWGGFASLEEAKRYIESQCPHVAP